MKEEQQINSYENKNKKKKKQKLNILQQFTTNSNERFSHEDGIRRRSRPLDERFSDGDSYSTTLR